jgi:hypothetical protein
MAMGGVPKPPQDRDHPHKRYKSLVMIQDVHIASAPTALGLVLRPLSGEEWAATAPTPWGLILCCGMHVGVPSLSEAGAAVEAVRRLP